MNIKELSIELNISELSINDLIRKGMPIDEHISKIKEWMSSESPSLEKRSIKKTQQGDRIKNELKLNKEYFLNQNKEYLKKNLSKKLYKESIEFIEKLDYEEPNRSILNKYLIHYNKILKDQKNETSSFDKDIYQKILSNKDKNQIYWGDSLEFLKSMPPESIQLMITSPPYYNARAYSQWDNIKSYLDDMKSIIEESFRVLENHRVFVWNVGDIFDNDKMVTNSVWGKRRIPLSAYFIQIFEDVGFTFVDDYIWDKGEVESKRQFNGGKNTPFYQYPLNSYEHILIFHKHELDKRKIPCPVCGSLNINGNTQSEIGLQSFECKNKKCAERSPSNRGKRFSHKTNTTQYLSQEFGDSTIDNDFIKKWRKDIIKLKPVFKINNKGENTLGHSAPFPEEIPEMAIKYFSFPGDNVLDPFAGSFTTCIKAFELNRTGIGCEINKEMYRDAIVSRLNDTIGVGNYTELN